MERKSMKKLSSAMITMAVMMLAIVSLIVAANAGYVPFTPSAEKNKPVYAPTDFYANITIRVFEGEGCECVPLRDVTVNVIGRDTDHYTSNVTDGSGSCVVYLQFGKTYRINISDSSHESAMVDFNVIDNQQFTFSLKLITGSSHHANIPIHLTLLQKLDLFKRLIR
jgi:hypothetical protein